MLLGPVEDLLRPPAADKDGRATGVISGDRFRWTGREIPYEIDPAIPNQDRITNAVRIWNESTVVKLKQRDGEANYVHFIRAPSGCSANVGMLGGRQLVNLGDACSLGNTVHEIGHSVGLHHTQGRNDRNLYLRVLLENINPSSRSAYDQVILAREDIGPYDYGAVMHYSDTGFAVSGRSAMQSIPAGIPIGQRGTLSAAEIQAVARLYGEPVRQVLIDTYPSGLPVVIDGEARVSPQSFDWTPGQRHTLSAPAQATGADDNTQHRFARWSDGGTPEHEIEIQAGGTVYIANYASYLRVRTAVTPAGSGTVEISPPSPDGFYPFGTTLFLKAVPDAGFRFFNWSPGAGGTTFLAANLQGNGSNPVEYNIRSSAAVYSATFTRGDFTVIDSVPSGAVVSVDGTAANTPRHVSWTAGSSHRVSIAASQSLLSDTFTRLQFQGWSNGGERDQTVVAQPGSSTITAELRVQHRAQVGAVFSRTSTAVAPPTAVRFEPAGDAGWFDVGSPILVEAGSTGELPFSNWTGELGGTANPRSIVMNRPLFATANHQSPRLLNTLGVVNEASRLHLTLSPGARMTLYTPEIGSADPVDLPNLPNEFNGISVEVDGKPAGLARIEPNAVTFVCPRDTPVHVPVLLRLRGVVRGTPLNLAVTVPAVLAAPGIYTLDGSGQGQAVATHADGSPSTPNSPVPRGNELRIAVTGLDPAASAIEVRVGGMAAEVLSVAPAGAAGRYTVAFRVPESAPAGSAVPLVVESAGARSQLTATIAVM